MKASAGTPFLQCGSATLLYYAAEAALKFADAHFVLLLLHNKGTYIAAVPYCLFTAFMAVTSAGFKPTTF